MAGTSTTSYSVHSQSGYKTFGYLKKAKEFAQRMANETGVSVGIYKNGGSGSWTMRPKKTNPFGLFKKFYVTCDGKKFGPFSTRAKANKTAVAIARVLDKPAKILGEAKTTANPKRKRRNPTVRTGKFKGSMSKGAMTRRRTPAQVGRAFGTPKNKRYLVGVSGHTGSYAYAAKMETAKKKGRSIAKRYHTSKFFVQNQVTGSILDFNVT